MLSHLFQGLLVGFSIAVPIGPVGILCIRRTLAAGQRAGYLTGFGAATAHLILGSITILSLTILSHFVTEHRFWFHLLGGLYLCIIGIQLFRKKPQLHERPLTGGYVTGLMITGTNPMTLVTFVTLLTSVGNAHIHSAIYANSLLIIGIFLSSLLWWITLCLFVHQLRHRFNKKLFLWLHRLSGTAFALFGLFLLGRV
ncbi:Threonine/homoserine/homoserine lactone efflux protein [Seinonella peptonophila]|uniref:Threonine/homoserine/homoserine lactone efflux protein n=1 Tax=Seinonella peptonophila TaxID=112248 RepID=A0A1M4WIJ5_9BACL|nr:LysE family transporter [Seinonella peptonophila]SHE81025.1 Threonine/homoserine/homoserine lactone efflux protein [Seinonella peptonophila]